MKKNLKAFLAFNKLPIRKIHSLVALAKFGAKKEPGLLDYLSDYKTLEAYYIESRYPPEARVYEYDEGEKAFQIAKRIVDFLKKHLPLMAYTLEE